MSFQSIELPHTASGVQGFGDQLPGLRISWRSIESLLGQLSFGFRCGSVFSPLVRVAESKIILPPAGKCYGLFAKCNLPKDAVFSALVGVKSPGNDAVAATNDYIFKGADGVLYDSRSSAYLGQFCNDVSPVDRVCELTNSKCCHHFCTGHTKMQHMSPSLFLSPSNTYTHTHTQTHTMDGAVH